MYFISCARILGSDNMKVVAFYSMANILNDTPKLFCNLYL